MAVTLGQWIKGLRTLLGQTQDQFATTVGTTQPTVTRWENGKAKPEEENLRRLHDLACDNHYHVEPIALLLGRPPTASIGKVPVVGYVGAGGEIFPVDDHPMGTGMDEVDAPVWTDGPLVAVRVRGDSMYPMVRDGWILFYSRDHDGVPEECINQLCVVKIADDGPTCVKELFRGHRKNLFTLHSWNAPPMENVRLDWAARVIDIRPRRPRIPD